MGKKKVVFHYTAVKPCYKVENLQVLLKVNHLTVTFFHGSISNVLSFTVSFCDEPTQFILIPIHINR